MKQLNVLSGGYRDVMDILLSVQTEMIAGINAPFASLQYDMVLSGCAVVDNGNGTVNIAPGLMYVAGQTLRFDGAENIPHDGSMAIVTGGAVASVLRPFGDGSNKNLYSEQKAVVAVQDITNLFQMKIGTSLYNLQQYIKDQVNAAEPLGTIKEMYDLDGTLLANFNEDGLGVTPAWMGWAMDNGNSGTPGSAGKVTVAAGVYTDPESGLETTYTAEDTDGEINHLLTVDEMPSHTHTTAVIFDTGGGAGPHPITTTPISRTNAGLAITPTGGGLVHNNMQPYMVVYRLVKISKSNQV